MNGKLLTNGLNSLYIFYTNLILMDSCLSLCYTVVETIEMENFDRLCVLVITIVLKTLL